MKTIGMEIKLMFGVLCLLATLSAAGAEDLVKAKDGSGVYGYKDTPKLPWCEWLVHDPDRPAPPRVDPGKAGPIAPVPADAIVLFDGTGLAKWKPAPGWEVKKGAIIAGNGGLSTVEEFGNIQLHVEWMAPANFEGPWYNRGNNGILLMGLFEIQIFDSYHEKIYPDGQCAAIYAQTPPLVNVTRPPGEWQTYDIVFTAPKFAAGKRVAPARVTMLHNGVLVHSNEEIRGATDHRVLPDNSRTVETGPLALSGHDCPVQFRSIWVRKL
jgi:hypothetical protein